jgi:hypothetical protein
MEVGSVRIGKDAFGKSADLRPRHEPDGRPPFWMTPDLAVLKIDLRLETPIRHLLFCEAIESGSSLPT